MPDVFISYGRSTSLQAEQLEGRLCELGYDVWRDNNLPAHRAYTTVIEEQLSAAKAVVVAWSHDAAKSDWVISEADRARGDGKLVQLRLDDVRLPMPFDRIQCADLTAWSGETEHQGWRIVLASVEALCGAGHGGVSLAALPRLSGKPSVAVMPFANLSNDPEQAYFADGIVEEIVAALSRFKSILVVSAGSSLVFKGKLATPQEAAQTLGVGYLLEGSVRKAGGRVRIGLHLIDAASGEQIWSDRLDDTLEDVFALQDRVAHIIAGMIEPTVHELDEKKATSRPTDNMSSWDFYLRSLPPFRISRKKEMQLAIDLLDRAIALDPEFAIALSQSCVCHRQMIDHGWCDDVERYRARGLELAERALRTGKDDAKVVAQVAASLPGLEQNLDRALTLAERAISLNPASSFVWLISGSVLLRKGEADLAAKHLELAMRLDPISSMNAFTRMYLAMARFQQGRLPESLALFTTTPLRLPVSYAVLAALYGRLGQRGQAQAALAQFRDITSCTIEHAASVWFPRPEPRKLFLEGLASIEGEPAPSAASAG